MLQSALLPGTSMPRAMQEDGASPGMTVSSQIRFRAHHPRGLAARWRGARSALAIALLCAVLGACTGEQFQKGYILPPNALEQIPIGASQEQVLVVLGTPSTVATVSGEVFYYISQRAERPVAFMTQHMVDQRVVAVYFDRNRRVDRLANYGMRDGKVFDYVSRTTPTGGTETAYLSNVLQAFKLF